MQRLNEKVRKNGFNYFQIYRSKDVAIYVQFDGGKKSGFEVFEIVQKKETNIKGVVIPEREKFPSNSDFGNTAFAANSLFSAIQRAYRLQKRILERRNSKEPNYFESLLNGI